MMKKSFWHEATDGKHAVVIDNGSGSIKAGFGGEAFAVETFPTVVGRSQKKENDPEAAEIYFGNEALSRNDSLILSCPIDQGMITNWEDMEKIWHHTFYNALKTSPEEHPILLTEVPLNPKANRERMTQIMFEKFNVTGMYLLQQAVLALYASGRTTGVVFDSGDGASHSMAIYEGHCLPRSVRRLDVAGKDLSDYLLKLLMEKGYSFENHEQSKVVKDIKEKLCYVCEDLEAEKKKFDHSSSLQKQYHLPEIEEIKVDSERFICPEPLFQPHLIGHEGEGCHQMIYQTVMACEVDIRGDFVQNIVVCGGNTMFEGFPERLKKELVSLFHRNLKINVVAAPERANSIWLGGAILTDLSTFQGMWVSKNEYDEAGPSIVHRKCF